MNCEQNGQQWNSTLFRGIEGADFQWRSQGTGVWRDHGHRIDDDHFGTVSETNCFKTEQKLAQIRSFPLFLLLAQVLLIQTGGRRL